MTPKQTFTLSMLYLLVLSCAILSCEEAQNILTPGAPNTIKIGLVLELPEQTATQYGAQLALTEINQQGGFMGIPLELVIKSNDDNAQRSAEVAEALISGDKVAALIGPNFSRNAIESAKIAQQHGVPIVTATATNPTVTDAGDYVFLGAFSDNFQGQVMAQFARRDLNARTAAILTQTDDLFSSGLSEIFAAAYTALGGSVVAREGYTIDEADFTTQLTAIAAVAPDVVFMPGFVEHVPVAIRKARTIPQPNASGITATFLGADSWDNPDLLSGVGNQLDGSYFTNHFSPEAQDPDAQAFVQAYRSMFGIAPDGRAAMGYDALRLVVTAMRRTGSLAPAAVRDQIAATRGYKGATSLLSYDENRHPTKSAVILRIENGRVRFHQQVEP